MTYEEFIQRKALIDHPTGIEKKVTLHKNLFPFQEACVSWALKRGRAALFCSTGLGKTPQQCEWSRHVAKHTNKPVLICAPLAVSHQTIAEAEKILGLEVTFAESDTDVKNKSLVYITNYQKLDRFDPMKFGGVALDESSIIKSIDGKTKDKLMQMFGRTPFRLACTATPAPNDYMELGNHAEFLGVMSSSEMLSTFFVHDGGETQKWRLKGHAEKDFWRWLASWAVCITKPSDIGFSDDGYILPPLRIHEVIVDCDSKPMEGELFAMPARTLQERREARRETIDERVAKAAEIINQHKGEKFLCWCNLNSESEAVSKLCNAVEVTGSDTDEEKTSRLLGFTQGDIERLVSKARIAGYGLNMQACHLMAFVGLNDSYEELFQAIRRCYRFGQLSAVDVYIIISSLEGEVLKNIKRKEADAQKMQAALVEHMAGFTKRQLKQATRDSIEYQAVEPMFIPSWLSSEQ